MPAEYPQAGGGGGASFYTHDQAVPSATWTIVHGLGYKPNVSVEDSAHNEVVGDVAWPNLNTVVLTFSSAFSGTAHLS